MSGILIYGGKAYLYAQRLGFHSPGTHFRYGTTPHGGFGLGFERLISWLGGWPNVRECIAAPRWKGRMVL